MRDNEYIVRFTYSRHGEGLRSETQWWCELYAMTPAHEADSTFKLAEGHGGTMAGAMQHAAMNWREGNAE